MTRFFLKLDANQSYGVLKEVCEKMGYTWKTGCTNQVQIVFGMEKKIYFSSMRHTTYCLENIVCSDCKAFLKGLLAKYFLV